MLLSIIMPVYNEMTTIAEIIHRVGEALVGLSKELIIVDDCSTDGTREYLQSLAERETRDGLTVKVIFHETNQGKGAAIRTAIAHVTGDIVLIQDADLEYDPSDYPRMLEPLEGGQADVVYGSRFLGSGPHRVLYFWHSVGNSILTLLSNMITNLNMTDMETCYKVFRREVIQSIPLEENRFGFEPEVTVKIARRNLRVYEVGISYWGRTYAEGKKIGWKDGFRALWCLAKYGIKEPKVPEPAAAE